MVVYRLWLSGVSAEVVKSTNVKKKKKTFNADLLELSFFLFVFSLFRVSRRNKGSELYWYIGRNFPHLNPQPLSPTTTDEVPQKNAQSWGSKKKKLTTRS